MQWSLQLNRVRSGIASWHSFMLNCFYIDTIKNIFEQKIGVGLPFLDILITVVYFNRATPM